ncbi:MAG: hypothetical protein ACRC6X_01710, partial [Culicoidibacterales bacterium]
KEISRISTGISEKNIEIKMNEGGILQYLLFVQIGMCVKVYKKEIFENIRFKEGILYEDLYFQSDLYADLLQKQKLRSFRTLNTYLKIYNYRKNDNSITRTLFTEEKYQDYLECLSSFKLKTPAYLYDFFVLRAEKHIKQQTNDDVFKNRVKTYIDDNNVSRYNAFFSIWGDWKRADVKRQKIFTYLEQSPELREYIEQKERETKKLMAENKKNATYIKKLERNLLKRLHLKIKNSIKCVITRSCRNNN